MNESVEQLFPVKVEEKKEAKQTVSLTLPPGQEYVDQEKLVPAGEELQKEAEVFHKNFSSSEDP